MIKTNSRLKITVIGDSTPLPRPRDGTKATDTYLFRLMQQDYIVFDKCFRAADSSDFLHSEKIEDFYDVDADFFIIHLGICDCAPRLFKKPTKLILEAMMYHQFSKKLASLYRYYYQKRRMYYTKKRCIQNVPLNEFISNMENIIENIIRYNLRIKKIMLVNIVYPGIFLREKSYGICKIVSDYNSTLNSLSNKFPIISLIDIYSESYKNPNLLLPDAHHLTNEGHELLFNEIKKRIAYECNNHRLRAYGAAVQ